MHKLFMIFLSLCIWCVSSLPNTSPLHVSREVSTFIMDREYLVIDMVYYAPNEVKPITAREFFESITPRGSYFAVGGADRSYINGALANTDSLIIVDNHPGIIAFNIISTLLIRRADCASSYRLYRNNIESILSLLEDEFTLEDIHLSKTDFLKACSDFWQKMHERFEQKFELLLSPVGQSRYCSQPHSPVLSEFEHTYANFLTLLCPGIGQAPFEDANFLYDEKLFKKVKKLADSVTIIQLDITDSTQLNTFVKNMGLQKRKISALDISNVFPIDYFCKTNLEDVHSEYRQNKNIKFYITPQDFQNFLKKMLPVCHLKTKIVSTQWNKNLETTLTVTPGNNVREMPHLDWDYTFGTFKDIYFKHCITLKTALPKR